MLTLVFHYAFQARKGAKIPYNIFGDILCASWKTAFLIFDHICAILLALGVLNTAISQKIEITASLQCGLRLVDMGLNTRFKGRRGVKIIHHTEIRRMRHT